MSRPSIKQFEKELDRLHNLTKERVRIGEITYSTKKDATDFDKRNWVIEAEEEVADAMAYTTFALMQLKSVYRLLRHCENRLAERVKEMDDGT